MIDGISEQARGVGALVLLSEGGAIPGPAGRLAEFFRALIVAGQSGEIGAGRDRGLPEIPALRHDPIAEILGGVFREDDAVDLDPFRIVRDHVLLRAPEFPGEILDLRARGGLEPGRKTAKIRPRLFQNQPKPLRNVVHAPRPGLLAEFVVEADPNKIAFGLVVSVRSKTVCELVEGESDNPGGTSKVRAGKSAANAVGKAVSAATTATTNRPPPRRSELNSLGAITCSPPSLKARENPSRSDRASRRTLRKLPFAVFNPDRTHPGCAFSPFIVLCNRFWRESR